MRTILGLILAMALLTAPVPARADETHDKVLALKEQIIDLQNQGQLGMVDFTICDKVLNFGSYVPNREARVEPGGKLLVYYEPINWFINRVQGRFEFNLTQDAAVLSLDGKELFNQKKMFTFTMNTAKPVFDLYVTNSLNLEGLPPGRYVYRATLHDEFKNAVASQTAEFEVGP